MHDELSFNSKAIMAMHPLYGCQVLMSKNIDPVTAAVILGGGALGGLLGGDEKSEVQIPGQVTNSLQSLQDIARSGTPDLPTQQIAGLSGSEQTGIDEIQKLIAAGGTSSSFQDAQSRITAFLDAPLDIAQTPEFQAIIRAAQDTGNDAVNQTLRRIQLSGVNNSSPGGKAVGREIGKTQQSIVAQLAPFAESARNRRFQALNQLLNIGQFETQNTQNLANKSLQIGGLERGIDQAGLDASFNTAQQKALFPFRETAGIHNMIIGGGAPLTQVIDPRATTDFSNALGGATGAAQLLPFLTGGGGGGGGQIGGGTLAKLNATNVAAGGG